MRVDASDGDPHRAGILRLSRGRGDGGESERGDDELLEYDEIPFCAACRGGLSAPFAGKGLRSERLPERQPRVRFASKTPRTDTTACRAGGSPSCANACGANGDDSRVSQSPLLANCRPHRVGRTWRLSERPASYGSHRRTSGRTGSTRAASSHGKCRCHARRAGPPHCAATTGKLASYRAATRDLGLSNRRRPGGMRENNRPKTPTWHCQGNEVEGAGSLTVTCLHYRSSGGRMETWNDTDLL